MAARDGKADRLAQAGMGLIDPARGLDLFGRLLAAAARRRSASFRPTGPRTDGWPAADCRRSSPALAGRMTRRHRRAAAPASPSALNRAALDGVPPDDWQPILEGQLREQAARVLRLAATALDVEQPLNNVGIDSLMAIELKNRIEADLGVTVPMVKFLEGPSVRDLAGYVASHCRTLATNRAVRRRPTRGRRPRRESS